MPSLRRLSEILAIGATVSVCMGCASLPTPSDAVREFFAADSRGDIEAALQLCTDDIVQVSPLAGEVRGKAAVRTRCRETFETFRRRLSVEVEGVLERGNEAIVSGRIHGEVHPHSGGAASTVDDLFTATLRRSGGPWRIRELVWRPRR